MSTPKNSGKQWTASDNATFKKLVRENTPTRLIAHKLDRSENAVYSHASEEGVSLKPTNQSPYNRQNKG